MKRPLTRRWMVFYIAVVAALLLGTAAFILVRQSQPPGPSWRGDPSGCRSTPMEHVHHPQRLQILAPCSTVSGTVAAVQYVSAYDDLKVTITPDATVAPYLEEANDGRVVVDVIATDQLHVSAPPVGSRVTVWGAWVRDKATKTTMMLPAYRIDIDQLSSDGSILRGESVEKRAPAPRRELRLTAKADSKVVVGGRVDVFFQATWVQAGAENPASQIRLFAEMTTANDAAVRWKATMTDTRGIAVLHLVAIQAPGPYLLTVYAAPSGQPATARVPVYVARA